MCHIHFVCIVLVCLLSVLLVLCVASLLEVVCRRLVCLLAVLFVGFSAAGGSDECVGSAGVVVVLRCGVTCMPCF